MKTDASNQITVRIFVGIEISSEIKMRLYESSSWKDALIVDAKDPQRMQIVPFEGKNYIGRFLAYKELTLKDLDQEAKHVADKLISYCPALKIDKNETVVFSQVFVA